MQGQSGTVLAAVASEIPEGRLTSDGEGGWLCDSVGLGALGEGRWRRADLNLSSAHA